MARKGWDDLTPSSRKRLEGAGLSGKLVAGDSLSPRDVEAYYRAGGDLRSAYGHAPRNPKAAPVASRAAAQRGKLNSDEDAAIERWRRKGGPAWIPSNAAVIGNDTAAILSGIDLPPSKWREVAFTVLADGRVQMTVTPKGNGYDRVVILPDRDSMGDVARLIQNPVGKGKSKAEQKRMQRQWGGMKVLRVNASGTDTKKKPPAGPADTRSPLPESKPAAPASGPSEPLTGGGRAAPPKKKAKKATKKATKKTTPKKRTPKRTTPAPGLSALDLIDAALGDAAALAEIATDELQQRIAELQAIVEGRNR